jgi:hypothetical protein
MGSTHGVALLALTRHAPAPSPDGGPWGPLPDALSGGSPAVPLAGRLDRGGPPGKHPLIKVSK